MQLQWHKCADDQWCLFDQLDLSEAGFDKFGVFVIWGNGDATRVSSVLYVGRGHLRDELTRCKGDSLFRAPGLRVTWAVVSELRLLDGIGAYLYRQLFPTWGEVVSPSRQPVQVNLPVSA